MRSFRSISLAGALSAGILLVLATSAYSQTSSKAEAVPQSATKTGTQATARQAAPQHAAPEPDAAASAESASDIVIHIPPVPLLWKVSDADNAVYVLGSFHLLKPDDYPLSPDVDAAFADAEYVMFEISPEEMASPTLGTEMGQAALRVDGTSLDSELPPATRAQLKAWTANNEAALQRMGLGPERLQQFEPWFVSLMISMTEMMKMGLDPKLGLDTHFAERAARAGKPAAGLETGLQQIGFLDGSSREEQRQMLADALDEAGEGRAEMEQLHRQWRDGDAEGIWQGLAAEMKATYPMLYQRINVERNDSWLPMIEQRLASSKDDTLLIVGALHALGGDGVVEKLRAKGYTIARICQACDVAAAAEAAAAAASKSSSEAESSDSSESSESEDSLQSTDQPELPTIAPSPKPR